MSQPSSPRLSFVVRVLSQRTLVLPRTQPESNPLHSPARPPVSYIHACTHARMTVARIRAISLAQFTSKKSKKNRRNQTTRSRRPLPQFCHPSLSGSESTIHSPPSATLQRSNPFLIIHVLPLFRDSQYATDTSWHQIASGAGENVQQ